MEKIKTPWVHKLLKVTKWIFLFLVGSYILLVVGRTIYLVNKHYADIKTNAEVEKIHNTRITLLDVMGTNLPPDPGVLADQTIAGVDANHNSIRDDVELAIFNAYPNSAKTRAVLLQYALALQMETIEPIVNTTTATEVIREQSRGFECIGNIVPRDNLQKFNEMTDFLTNFIKSKQFNTKERQNARDLFLKNVESYSGLDRICDIDYSTLPN